ncbi:MAG: OadG family protein [Chloroflexi bacterium]|nr:OadG family protein [Chloroflexota bacterium]
MAENLSTALQITAIGMSLVFGGILILWGLMTVLLSLTTPKNKEAAVVTPSKTSEPNEAYARKQQVAALAVALALAQERDQQKPQAFPMPPTAIVSAWQAVMRTNQLKRRGTR